MKFLKKKTRQWAEKQQNKVTKIYFEELTRHAEEMQREIVKDNWDLKFNVMLNAHVKFFNYMVGTYEKQQKTNELEKAITAFKGTVGNLLELKDNLNNKEKEESLKILNWYETQLKELTGAWV